MIFFLSCKALLKVFLFHLLFDQKYLLLKGIVIYAWLDRITENDDQLSKRNHHRYAFRMLYMKHKILDKIVSINKLSQASTLIRTARTLKYVNIYLFCRTDDSITFNKVEIMDQISFLIDAFLVNCLRPFVKADVEVKEAFKIASACTMKQINKC